MAYEQRDFTGSLFKNDRKESDNHPDYKGGGMIGGVEVWIDAWIKKKEGSKTYMSLSFKPKDVQSKPAPRRGAEPKFSDVDSDIPF